MAGLGKRPVIDRVAVAALIVLAMAWISSRSAVAQPILADLSDHLISITTDYVGTEVVLFGATDGPGDVAIVVKGPEDQVLVRRKERIAGIWLNGESLAFTGVPTFYGVASNRPMTDFADIGALDRHDIGLENLSLNPVEDVPDEIRAEYGDALIRQFQNRGLYPHDIGTVVFLGERLFRTTLSFPANIPTGLYTINVFLFRDGEVVGAQTTPLHVSKIGLGARIFRYAQQYGTIYGLAAVAFAIFLGWLAGTLLRRR